MVAKSFNRMVGSFQLSPIKRACGNVQPDAGGLNLFTTCICSPMFENRFMTSQFTNTQPAEFTQYTKFQHFTRCVHPKFCCAFTSILAVKQGKIDWIDNETFPTRYYLIKRYRLLHFGITMKLTSIDQPWTLKHEIQEQFIFFNCCIFSKVCLENARVSSNSLNR